MAITLDYEKLKEIYFRDRQVYDANGAATKNAVVIAKERSLEFQRELNESGFFDLSEEEYAIAERELARQFGIPSYSIDCKSDAAVRAHEIVEDLGRGGSEVSGISKVRTLQQQIPGSLTAHETNEILLADKRLLESFGPVVFTPSSARAKTSSNITYSFYEATVDGKTVLLREVNSVKFDRQTGDLNYPENSLYVVLDRDSAGVPDMESDMLVCRMDTSSRAHDNRAFIGGDSERVIGLQASGYHFHFSNLLGNLLAIKVADGQTAIQHSSSTYNALDGIDLGSLESYLGALDEYRASGGSERGEAFSGVDLEQTFNLPFRVMMTRGIFPSCDLTRFCEQHKDFIDRFPDMAAARDAYLNAPKQEGSFEGIRAAMKFLLAAESCDDAIFNNTSVSQADKTESRTITNGLATSVFKSVSGVISMEMAKTKEETTLQNEADTIGQEAAEAKPTAADLGQSTTQLTLDETNSKANELVDKATQDLYGELTADDTKQAVQTAEKAKDGEEK